MKNVSMKKSFFFAVAMTVFGAIQANAASVCIATCLISYPGFELYGAKIPVRGSGETRCRHLNNSTEIAKWKLKRLRRK